MSLGGCSGLRAARLVAVGGQPYAELRSVSGCFPGESAARSLVCADISVAVGESSRHTVAGKVARLGALCNGTLKPAGLDELPRAHGHISFFGIID